MKCPQGVELSRAQPERAVCGIVRVERRSGPLRSRRSRRRRDECGRNFSESMVMGLLLPGCLPAGRLQHDAAAEVGKKEEWRVSRAPITMITLSEMTASVYSV